MVEPLTLVHGDDPYLVTTTAHRLRQELTADLVSDLGLEEFRSSRDLDAISRSLATPPFLAIRRVVMIWDPPQLEGGQRMAREAEQLATTIGTRLETTAVVVVSRSPVAASSPLLKAVKSQGGQVRWLRRPRGRELRQFVDDHVRERGIKLGRAVLGRLIDVAGQDLGRLDRELEKLEIFAAGGGRVGDREGLLLVPASPPTELYRLTDTLFEAPGRVGERVAELAGYADWPPPAVVGALARVLRDLISFADPGDRERWRSQVPWREEKMRSHLERAGEARLRRWLVQLAELDWATRTGAVDAQEGLELVLARMASELRSPAPS